MRFFSVGSYGDGGFGFAADCVGFWLWLVCIWVVW